MKNILPVLGMVAVLAACNTGDSAAEKELAILRTKQATIDSMNIVAAQKEAKAASYTAGVRKSTPVKRSSSSGRISSYAAYNEPAVLPVAPVQQAKKGWSNKAKGAVIGGVVGAVTGAAVSKDKKGKGAVIGGILGAAGGFGVGAVLDKKSGR